MTTAIIDDKIFNTEKTDYEDTPLFLGQASGLYDTINGKYPQIENLTLKMQALDWSEREVPFDTCNAEFKSVPKSIYDMAFLNLAFQWEGDSVAARSLTPIMAPFVSSSQLWTAYTEIQKNEGVHARAYGEMVRLSFDDPNAVIRHIHSLKDTFYRLKTVGQVFRDAYVASHKYALGMIPNDKHLYKTLMLYVVAIYLMERIQFMASFAVTFCLSDEGLFMPIGQVVQKICQDEFEVHARLGEAVLDIELQTHRGMMFWYENSDQIKQMIMDVTQSEIENIKYLHQEGRRLPNATEKQLADWVYWNVLPVYSFFRIRPEVPVLTKNPLPIMNNWTNIGLQQNSPQEQKNMQYFLGQVVDRLGNKPVMDLSYLDAQFA